MRRLGDDEGQPYWLEHPVHGPRVVAIALPLRGLLEQGGLGLITYPHLPPTARMELGTELQVIGSPIGFNRIEDNVPLGVWTRGTIAWPPNLPWRNLPAFLIDCHSRAGKSGSPVVLAVNEFTRYRHACGHIEIRPVHELIGVYSGRIHDCADVGIVWKRDAVREIVGHGVRPEKPWVAPLEVPLPPLPEP